MLIYANFILVGSDTCPEKDCVVCDDGEAPEQGQCCKLIIIIYVNLC